MPARPALRHAPFPPALRRLAGLLAAALAALVAAPAAAAPATEAELLARIQAEVGEAQCTADTDCHTLPIGARACGGPERWLAWSGTPARGERLKAWSDQLASRAGSRQARSGRVSTCQVLPDPGAHCDAGRCTLNTGGAATLPVR